MRRYSQLIVLLALMIPMLSWASVPSRGEITFRRGGTLLLKEYKSNAATLSAVERWIKSSYRPTTPSGGYVRIVANYSENTAQAINEASIQGSCLANYLRKVSGDKNFRYTFHLNHSITSNTLTVECKSGSIPASDNRQIHYSLQEKWVQVALSRYSTGAFLQQRPAALSRAQGASADVYKADYQTTFLDDAASLDIAIYYRFDDATLDSTYLTNTRNLQLIDSLMHLSSAQYIDSLHIIGYASPEGNMEYNRRLSHRRALSVKAYLLNKYPDLIRPETVITQAGGENWGGLRQMVENDDHLPMKEQVLSILNNSSITDAQRKWRLQRLADGTIYRNYMLPRYFRYLRSGASLIFSYDVQPVGTDTVVVIPPIVEEVVAEVEEEPVNEEPVDTAAYTPPAVVHPKAIEWYDTTYVRPIALKTNMLYNLATALNVEIEVPIAPRWSIAGEWMFPWWVGEKRQHALQILQGSLEARYWFNPNFRKQEPRLGRHNPLTGWFVGAYGSAGYYDFEVSRKGFQGDLYGAGLSAGYVLPLARNFNMEFSLGVGYLQSAFWNYEAKKDIFGDWHLIRTTRGKLSTLALPVRNEHSGIWLLPYKAKVSFIWYPHFRSIKKKGGSK